MQAGLHNDFIIVCIFLLFESSYRWLILACMGKMRPVFGESELPCNAICVPDLAESVPLFSQSSKMGHQPAELLYLLFLTYTPNTVVSFSLWRAGPCFNLLSFSLFLQPISTIIVWLFFLLLYVIVFYD